MNAEIALTVDRVKRSRAAVQQRQGERLLPRNTVSATTSGALIVGARVFDSVTGQEGEIVGGTRENIIVPTAAR